MSKVTTATIRQMKSEGKPITMLTAYDYSMAKLVDDAGIDMILVGDSLANVMLGYDSTLPVTMDEMVHHVKAVCRGAVRAMVVAMMSTRFRKATPAQFGAVTRKLPHRRLSWKAEEIADMSAIVNAGIRYQAPGADSQSVTDGWLQGAGKDESAAKNYFRRQGEEAGHFAGLNVCLPLAKLITESLGIPTIGIRAPAL